MGLCLHENMVRSVSFTQTWDETWQNKTHTVECQGSFVHHDHEKIKIKFQSIGFCQAKYQMLSGHIWLQQLKSSCGNNSSVTQPKTTEVLNIVCQFNELQFLRKSAIVHYYQNIILGGWEKSRSPFMHLKFSQHLRGAIDNYISFLSLISIISATEIIIFGKILVFAVEQ